jgi:iron complex outermembrane receptor protein
MNQAADSRFVSASIVVNASSDPLMVLDGVPIGTGSGGGLSAGRNPLNFLNPNDIEHHRPEGRLVGGDLRGKRRERRRTHPDQVRLARKAGVRISREHLRLEHHEAADHAERGGSSDRGQQYAPQNVSQLRARARTGTNLVAAAYGQEHNLGHRSGNSMNWRLSGGFLRQGWRHRGHDD